MSIPSPLLLSSPPPSDTGNARIEGILESDISLPDIFAVDVNGFCKRAFLPPRSIPSLCGDNYSCELSRFSTVASIADTA